MNSELKSNIEINIPSEKNFGIVFSVIFFLLFLFFYINNNYNFNFFCYFFLISSIIILFFSHFFSIILFYPNLIWFKFGMLISAIISPIILFIVFVVAFVIIGVLIKIFKGSLLKTRYNKNQNTYWEIRKYKVQSMEKQF